MADEAKAQLMISDHLKPEARRRRYRVQSTYFMSEYPTMSGALHKAFIGFDVHTMGNCGDDDSYAITVTDLATGERLVSYEVQR